MNKNKITNIENDIEDTLYKLIKANLAPSSVSEAEKVTNMIRNLSESYNIIHELKYRAYGER